MFKKIFTSNRFLWILFFVFAIVIIYFLYLIFFVKYTGGLIIESNVDNYKVKLSVKNMFVNLNYDCDKKICEIKNLSPFTYEFNATKQNYKNIKQEIKIIGKNIKKISLNFIKDTNISEVDVKKKTQVNPNLIESYQSWLFLFETIEWLGNFYIKENWEKFDVYNDLWWEERILFSLPRNETEISIQKIYWSNDKIFVNTKNKKYIYNLDNWILKDFYLKNSVNYVKIWINWEYQIVNNLWTYIYNENTNKLAYFYLFKDYVDLDDWYIGIIYAYEKEKLENFWIDKILNKNIILNYSISWFKRDIIFETVLKIDKIIKENDKVYIYDESWKKYELKNF